MNVLYLSYDGMTDPLGQSQVLPYLIGLSSKGHRFTLISFEKKDRFVMQRTNIQSLCQQHNINWKPLRFTEGLSVLGKLWDLYAMLQAANAEAYQQKFHLLHCRSYISAWVAVRLKKKQNTPLLFDMRGFWVDERVEGGLWNLSNPFFKLAYRVAKKQEVQLLRYSDAVITLTQASLLPIRQWLEGHCMPLVEVIPCSADTTLFTVPSAAQRSEAKKKLGLPAEAVVLCYLGSVGTWYLLSEMIAFYKVMKADFPMAKFLFLSPGEHDFIKTSFLRAGLSESDVVLASAARNQVPQTLAAADIGIMFIKTSFSKTASSPTKLGELLAMGIPVICNAGVGDVKEIVELMNAGHVLTNTDDEAYREGVRQIPRLLSISKELLRASALPYYDLPLAIEKYERVYQQLAKA